MIWVVLIHASADEPAGRYSRGTDHILARAAQIETRCNVPVHLDVHTDDARLGGGYRAYPPVSADDCSVDALLSALQTSLDHAPCTYRVEADLGGLVVSPTHVVEGACVLAPSRLDEVLPVVADGSAFWEEVEARGLRIPRVDPPFFRPPVEPITLRQWLRDRASRSNASTRMGPRRVAYRAYAPGDLYLGFWVQLGGPYADSFEQPEGPYDYRTQWWVGDTGPRYRPPTEAEGIAYSEMNERYFIKGDVSDLEYDTFFEDAMRARVLNPRADGREWGEGMYLRLKHPSEYDVNGCKIDTPCAARHGGWQPGEWPNPRWPPFPRNSRSSQ